MSHNSYGLVCSKVLRRWCWVERIRMHASWSP